MLTSRELIHRNYKISKPVTIIGVTYQKLSITSYENLRELTLKFYRNIYKVCFIK